MLPRNLRLRLLIREIETEDLDDILDELIIAADMYRDTMEYEHVIDAYFAALSLLLKTSDFDNKLIEMIEEDLELFYPQLN